MLSVRAPAPPARRLAIVPERLESCVRRLDPGDRALLDLSLNRGIPDAAMAPLLRADPLRLAWKRARAIERVASRLGLSHPADLAEVRAALMDLPSRAWLPLELQPPRKPPVLEPPEPAGAEPIVFKPRGPEEVRASLRAAAGPALARAAAAEPRGVDAAAVLATSGRSPAVREAAPARADGDAAVVRGAPAARGAAARPSGRAASFTLGGLSERAQRAYPRGGMTTRARRAVGAIAVGVAAIAAIRRS